MTNEEEKQKKNISKRASNLKTAKIEHKIVVTNFNYFYLKPC